MLWPFAHTGGKRGRRVLFHVQGTENTVNTDVAGASPARVYVPLEPLTRRAYSQQSEEIDPQKPKGATLGLQGQSRSRPKPLKPKPQTLNPKPSLTTLAKNGRIALEERVGRAGAGE